MDSKSPSRILPALLIAALLGSCHWLEFHTVSGGGVSCEAPRTWEHVPGGGALVFLSSPDEVREVGAFIAIDEDKPRARADLEKRLESTKRTFREDPNFSFHPITEVPIAGTRGYLLTSTVTRYAKLHHRTTPLPAPVKLRRYKVFFTAGAKGYLLQYEVPIDLDVEYAPVFERVLRTLKVEPKS
ncbi:MAG: hypothetical protein HY553_21565 [Elusimicrobia bacterium]|nr:hypothetical protein [Elusimicrobiota bacterium]